MCMLECNLSNKRSHAYIFSRAVSYSSKFEVNLHCLLGFEECQTGPDSRNYADRPSLHCFTAQAPIEQ